MTRRAAIAFVFSERDPESFQEIVDKAKNLFSDRDEVKIYAAIRDAADSITKIFESQPNQSDQPFEFYTSEGETLTIEDAAYQAIGAASICWSETPRGVFDSDRAKIIGKAFIEVVEKQILMAKES